MRHQEKHLSLADAMALIVAAAIGAAMVRLWYPTFIGESEGRVDIEFCYKSACWFLMPFSPICLILRLVHLRPPGRKWSFAPGLWAHAAIVLGTLIATVEIDLYTWSHGINRWDESWKRWLASDLWSEVWKIVLAAWCFLGLSGQWRSEPSWIDRFGCVLGVFWLGVFGVSVGHTYWLHH